MKPYSTNQIFVPGGLPELTYVARTEQDLEVRLRQVRDNLCKLVTLTGPTKCGKTVLAHREFPREKVVWLDGGVFSDEVGLWLEVNTQLNQPTAVTTSSASTPTSKMGGEIGGAIGLGGTQLQGKFSLAQESQHSTSTAQMRFGDPKAVAVAALRTSRTPLVIDDFHYLPRSLQESVIRALKPLIFHGVPVVVLAIPHRRYDAIRVEREMTGRVENVQVPAWDESELAEIARVGFPLLGMDVSDATIADLASEALGSPHLMQEFCRQLCRNLGVDKTVASHLRVPAGAADKSLFKNVAAATGRTMFERLKRGPRMRSDRISRKLSSGEETDIYGVVLRGLASLRPGIQTVAYEELRGAIRQVCAEQPPQAHEVSRVLEKMAEISSSDEASTPVIDWDKDNNLLHITDPFFAYYLRWGEIDLSDGSLRLGYA